MHHLYEFISREKKECIRFYEELRNIEDSSLEHISSHRLEVKQLSDGFSALKKEMERLEEVDGAEEDDLMLNKIALFVKNYEPTIMEIEKNASQLFKDHDSMLTWFGAEKGEDVQMFVSQFCKQFELIHLEMSKMKEEEDKAMRKMERSKISQVDLDTTTDKYLKTSFGQNEELDMHSPVVVRKSRISNRGKSKSRIRRGGGDDDDDDM